MRLYPIGAKYLRHTADLPTPGYPTKRTISRVRGFGIRGMCVGVKRGTIKFRRINPDKRSAGTLNIHSGRSATLNPSSLNFDWVGCFKKYSWQKFSTVFEGLMILLPPEWRKVDQHSKPTFYPWRRSLHLYPPRHQRKTMQICLRV